MSPVPNFSNDIYIICNEKFNIINSYEIKSINKNTGTYYVFSNWEKIYNALIAINEIKTLEPTVQEILGKIPSYYLKKDKFELDGNDYNIIKKSLEKLKIEINQIIKLGKMININKEGEIYINVKTPLVTNIEDYSKIIESINKVFNQCSFFKNEKENIIYKGVDIGSSWLLFAIVGVTGVSILMNNIQAFIEGCLIIYSHYLNIEKQKEELEQEKRDNQFKEEMKKFLLNSYKKQAKEIIKNIEKKTNIKCKDEEEYDRNIKMAEELGKLINKGLQILPSINVQKENKVLFEPIQMKYIDVMKILGIEEKEENKNELNN